MNGMKDIADFIERHDDFLIISHVSPDGDTIGSALALYAALESLGKRVQLSCSDGVPAKYAFLKNAERVELPDGLRPFSAVIYVDCGSLDRAGSLTERVQGLPCCVIDHHRTNTGFADVNWVERRSSCGEMMTELIRALGAELDRDTAVCLYTAITSDTGNFAYAGTNAATFMACAELVKTGFDLPELNRLLFRSMPLSKAKLIGRVLSRAELLCGDKLGFFAIDLPEIQELGATAADFDGVVDYIRDIECTETACIVRKDDKGDAIRVSVRSKHDFDVSKVMANFGGGGHMRAAGCTLHGDFQEAVKLVREAIINELVTQGIWTE